MMQTKFDIDRCRPILASIPAQLWRPGQIVAYTGILGAGKTALMTLVCLAARLYGGVDVFANYDAAEAGFRRLQNMFDVFDRSRCLVALDEIQHIGVDSRDSMQRVRKAEIDPRFILYWFDLIRKDDVSVHYTTQDIGKADKRIREITGFVMDSIETDIPHVSKVRILRYAGGEEAQQIGAFVWDKSIIYGAYNTKDKNVLLPLDPDGAPRSPFPTREQLLRAAVQPLPVAPPPRAGRRPSAGAPAAPPVTVDPGPNRDESLIDW